MISWHTDENIKHDAYQVKYMTRGATWTPSYDLRVDTLTDSISCTYYGMVTQTTTEDWKGGQRCMATFCS